MNYHIMVGWKSIGLSLLVLLLGCSGAPELDDSDTSVTPTYSITEETTPPISTSSPTIVLVDTQIATVSPTGTLTSTPTFTRTLEPVIPLPTLALPTQTVTEVPQPEASSGAIQFYKPGPMSRVISPVRFYGYAIPGDDRKGLIELYGEDGTILNSEILQLNTEYKWAFFSWSLEFSPRGAGEMGRLSLSTRDQYGRLSAIKSVPLLLLADGYEIITPAEAMVERVVLTEPQVGKRVSGGMVKVTGKMKSYNQQPLTVELITAGGTILGSKWVLIPAGEAGDYFEFRVDIPYEVRTSTSVLLTIKQPDEVIPGIIYLYSQEMTISP